MPVASAKEHLPRGNALRWSFAASAAVVGFPLWVAAAVVLDFSGQRPDPPGPWDAIIVAGCPVLPNGLPSESLKRRTMKAVRLWQNRVAPIIIVTGGGQPSEAEVAATYARQQGIPDRALLLESRSSTTLENARFARALTRAARIIVVTDAYHVYRCERFFRKYFAEVTAVGVVSPPWQRAKGAFREAIAIGYFGLRGTGA